jgi:arsenite-transporting ATPase
MRILLFAGKGGVGKTSVAAATGLKLARRGYRTLVLSLDPAHSLSDSFDLPGTLVDHGRGGLVSIEKNLEIQEIDVLEEVHRHWSEVHSYLSVLIAGAGLDEVLAEELAIIPGMEEASCLLYINQYARENRYDCLVLDCAPTAESLRFISFPSILRWYINRLWKIEKTVVKVARPVLKHVLDVPLPSDEYFDNLRALFEKIDGVDHLLTDPKKTSVRLVTNPEQMVVKETQRAFMYFNLYSILVDGLVVNRVIPESVEDPYFQVWKKNQAKMLEQIDHQFGGIPQFRIPLMTEEVLGVERLDVLGDKVYGDQDPAKLFSKQRPFAFKKKGKKMVLEMTLPFLTSDEIDVTRVDDELIVRVASWKRHIPLPRSIPPEAEVEANLTEHELTITFR